MAKKTTSVPLNDPIVWFDKRLDHIVLKAPTGGQFLALGEPRFLVRMNDGSAYWVEREEVVKLYISDLLTLDGTTPIDSGDHILLTMSLTDAMAIKESLFDFFTDAAAVISQRRLTCLSSDSKLSQPMPAIA
jgi:hypothetical protein